MVILGCHLCLKSQLTSEDAECPLFPNYCPLRLDSQEKTDSPHVADFRLECCVPRESARNTISGRKFPLRIVAV